MTEFDAKPCKRCERVNDESTPVAGVVGAFVGIRPRLAGAVNTDRVDDPLIVVLGMGPTSLGVR